MMWLSPTHSSLPDSIALPPRWRRHVLSVAVVALVAAGVVCRRSATAPVPDGDQSRYHDRSFHVARVVDGDTLDIDAPDGAKDVTRIRLWGVDTPEIGHGGREGVHFGREAEEFARGTLAGRRVHVVLSPRRTRGKYGRLLAYVYLERGGTMFNELLLEKGYAYADLRFDHHYFDRFKAIEKRARKNRTGLWADVTLDRMPAWKQRFERGKTKRGD